MLQASAMSSAPPPPPSTAPSRVLLGCDLVATYHQYYVTYDTTIKHKLINWQEGTGINLL